MKRPGAHFPTSMDVFRKLKPTSKYYFTCDISSAYHQVEISPNSQDLFAFRLEQGIFCYKRAAMGFSASGDYMVNITDTMLADLDLQKEVDDILLEADSCESMPEKMIPFFERCRRHGIFLSRSKIEAGTNVEYAGIEINTEIGCRPARSKYRALQDLKPPESVKELRSFMGLINYLAQICPDMRQHTPRIRALLKKENKWQWTRKHQEEFENIKEALTNDTFLKPFNPGWITQLYTDFSKQGIGFCLIQINPNDHKDKILIWASSLKHLCKRDSLLCPLYGEAMAICRSIKACAFWLRGIEKFYVITDHKNLISIFNRKKLGELSDELLCLVLSVQNYNFEVQYVKGKLNCLSDFLSRRPKWGILDHENDENKLMESSARSMLESPMTTEMYDEILSDRTYMDIIRLIQEGKKKHEIKNIQLDGLDEYKQAWEFLGVLEDKNRTIITYKDSRLVPPRSFRQKLLSLLHIPHLGETNTLRAATSRYWWLHMDKDIKQKVSGCDTCIQISSTLKREAAMPNETPLSDLKPGQDLHADFGTYKKDRYLILVDRFSGYVWCEKIGSIQGNTTTSKVVEVIKKISYQLGFPRRFTSDSGPEFKLDNKELSKALGELGCFHQVSSVNKPSSNLRSETAVKSAKAILKKAEVSGGCPKLMLFYSNIIPRENGLSPAEMLLGYRPRSALPEIDKALDFGKGIMRRQKEEEKRVLGSEYRGNYPLLGIGDLVYIKNKETGRYDIPGRVKDRLPHGRSYHVQTEDRTIYLRNRIYLKIRSPPIPVILVSANEKLESILKKKYSNKYYFRQVSYDLSWIDQVKEWKRTKRERSVKNYGKYDEWKTRWEQSNARNEGQVESKCAEVEVNDDVYWGGH